MTMSYPFMHLLYDTHSFIFFFFFFNDTATTEIYTLSLHDALPISVGEQLAQPRQHLVVEDALHLARHARHREDVRLRDRKSTRLNSSHVSISYAVFCLKKKKINKKQM